MRVLVVGAGLIGVMTAYFLRRLGYQVTVVDRQGGAGLETSFANGALLTPSMSDPWNAPGVWRLMLKSFGRTDSPMQLRWRALPGLARWGVAFLRNSVPATFERNTLSNLSLALHSLRVMQQLNDETGIQYDRSANGTLRIFRQPRALDAACVAGERLAHQGLPFRRLSVSEMLELEPALGPIAKRLAGAIHYRADETGDAHRFCVALADKAREDGVNFEFRTLVSSLELNSGRVISAHGNRQRFTADRYVIAAGSFSAPLLRPVGVHVPVKPAKGYSITFVDGSDACPLSIPIVDDHLHAAVVPIGTAIRVAGTAEFAGYDLSLNRARLDNLLGLLREVLPDGRFDSQRARAWCGLRPMTVDGVPVIGATRISNLFVNTGHGHLGWTMAAGSGSLLADLMSGRPAPIDPLPFSPARFG